MARSRLNQNEFFDKWIEDPFFEHDHNETLYSHSRAIVSGEEETVIAYWNINSHQINIVNPFGSKSGMYSSLNRRHIKKLVDRVVEYNKKHVNTPILIVYYDEVG